MHGLLIFAVAIFIDWACDMVIAMAEASFNLFDPLICLADGKLRIIIRYGLNSLFNFTFSGFQISLEFKSIQNYDGYDAFAVTFLSRRIAELIILFARLVPETRLVRLTSTR
jgi:hypothetical protein